MQRVSVTLWRFAKQHPLPFFLLGTLITLLTLNQWLWPTTDEYLYAATARSMVAGLQGDTCLSCINTEHPALVAALVAAHQWLFKLGPFNLVASRIPIILISLATIGLIWLTGKRIAQVPRERAWFLLLLLLLPGYFILSTRLMLDIPLTACFALICYLLLIRANPFWIGLALCAATLTKGYGFLLTSPLVLGLFTLDAFAERSGGWRTLMRFIGQLLGAFLPPLLIATLILTTNVLPYPRLLETNFLEYSGGAYLFFAKQALLPLNAVSTFTQSILSHFLPTHAVDPLDTLSNKAARITITSSFPTALIESPLQTDFTGGFFKRLWLIYRFNFSEQDVSVFLLPLFLTGITLRFRRLISLGSEWVHERADALFLMLTAIFAYLNWHEALNVHGFRLTAPVSLALIYFAYWGLRALLTEESRLARWVFSVTFFGSLILYIQFVQSLGDYRSVIASTEGLLATLLAYKLVLFSAIFIAIFFFVLTYPTVRMRGKRFVLPVLFTFLFILKLIPFGLEAHAETAMFGFDYGLQKAAPILHELREAGEPVVTNARPYVMDYYALNLSLPNAGVSPLLRTFAEYNPVLYTRFDTVTRPLTAELLDSAKTQYVYYVNMGATSDSLEAFHRALTELDRPSYLIAQARHPATQRVQWELYRIDFSLPDPS